MLEVKKIFEELLNIDALTYDRGEVDIAKALYNIYLGLDYFKDHPENVKLLATDEDEFVRFNQMAMVQKGDSKDVVLIINTIDEPQLTGKYSKSDVKIIKSTLASNVVVLDELSKTDFDGNVMILNICDRYGNNKGMESAVKYIMSMKEECYNFKAAITTHSFLTNGEEAIFFGAQAIIKPAIFVAGKTVRTLLFDEGLDPSYMLSTFARDLTLNSVLMDNYQNEVSEPIYVNRFIVPGGTEVQSSAWGYTSFMTSTVNQDLKAYMNNLKNLVINSYNKAIAELNTKYASYCLKRNIPFSPLKIRPKVYTWDEYLNEIITVRGNSVLSSLRNDVEDKINRSPDLPLSELRLQLVKNVYDKHKLADEPIIIIYFEEAPSQRVDITGTNTLQRDLMLSFTSAINTVKPTIKRRFFYPDMSYHSYLNLSEDYRDLKESLKFIPMARPEEYHRINNAAKLSIPTINVGGINKIQDGKFTFDEKYHFETYPALMIEGIKRLFKCN